MKHLNKPTKITILIKYESSIEKKFVHDINDKLETVIQEFISNINVKEKNLIFLCNGAQLKGNDFKKSISQIMDNNNKEQKLLVILSYKKIFDDQSYISGANNIKINLIIDYEKAEKLNGKKGEPLINIIKRANIEINSELNLLTFYYRNKKIDINKTFENIADERDKHDEEILIIVKHKGFIKVNFIRNSIGIKVIKSIYCLPQEKIIEVCNKFCHGNNLNINKLQFLVNNNYVNFEETVYELFNRINYNNETWSNFQVNNTFIENNAFNEDKIQEIKIEVREKKEIINTDDSSCIKKHKKIIIIISSILGVLIIGGIIIAIIVARSKSSNKNNNSSSNTQIIKDTTKYTNEPFDSINNAESFDNTYTKTEEIVDSISKVEEPSNNPQNTNVICEKGYFIPKDFLTLKDCQKCSLEGCAKCSGTVSNNICTDCGDLISVYENGKIIKCSVNTKSICDIGSEEKCLSCVENKNECQTCNIAYKLDKGKCVPDYFLAVIYLTKQKEDKIKIINSYSIVEHIITEGKKITLDSVNYEFKEEGNQTVYFQFKNEWCFYEGLFSNIKHIKEVILSNFNEYYMRIPLNSMFSGCTNLTSVDFSKLDYIYSSSMNYMFNECINLTYVNIKNLKAGYYVQFMFNNCRSLTSIDLSKIDISGAENLNNMFTNCSSLQSVNLKGFKLDSTYTMKSLFYNCYSLKYLDLSSFKPSRLYDVNFAFYNCSSLTSINFLDFYSELTEMVYLFFNCSSLKQLDLTDFNTNKAKKMYGMFEGCNSLTSIIAGPNFIINNAEEINTMFLGCHSLKSIGFDIVITNKISELESFFSDCYSLTSINLKNFDTSNVNNFHNMFHNCYNLKDIDISNFRFRRNANLKGMFSGCYSLTSIDFSNISPDHYQFDEIFYDCPNLNYLNFSFVHYVSYYSPNHYIFNQNISKSGTLILNEDYYNSFLKDLGIYPPYGWTLYLTN